jgi:hypothetical protein
MHICCAFFIFSPKIVLLLENCEKIIHRKKVKVTEVPSEPSTHPGKSIAQMVHVQNLSHFEETMSVPHSTSQLSVN